MKFSVKQIAQMINAEIVGNGEIEISSFSGIENATKNDISFISNKKYENFLITSNAGCVIVDSSINPDILKKATTTLLLVKNSYIAFTILLQNYALLNTKKRSGISSNAVVKQNSKIHSSCFIGDLSYVGENTTVGEETQISAQVYIGDNVTIGKNCFIHPGVRILDNTLMGDRVIIQSGAVIGSDGFGFAPKENGEYLKIPQLGIVVIEDDVEIGANTTIDRATTDKTVISQGTKIDNLVQIAHNVKLGKHIVIASQSGVSGSASIGNYCRLAGQSGISGHITIVNNVDIGPQCGVSKSIKKSGASFIGTPGIEVKEFVRNIFYTKKIESLFNRIQEIEKKINKD